MTLTAGVLMHYFWCKKKSKFLRKQRAESKLSYLDIEDAPENLPLLSGLSSWTAYVSPLQKEIKNKFLSIGDKFMVDMHQHHADISMGPGSFTKPKLDYVRFKESLD